MGGSIEKTREDPNAVAAGPIFSLHFIVFFAWAGILLPFLPVYLSERGLPEATIGLVLAFTPWARFIVNPIVAPLADRRGLGRELIVGMTGLAIVGSALFFLGDPLIALACLLLAVGTAPIIPLGDALAIQRAEAGELDYPKSRLLGSIAFIVTSYLAGVLLDAYGAMTVPIASLVFTIGIALVAVYLPRGRPEPSAQIKNPFASFKILLRPRIGRVLLAAILIQASHAALYNFGSLHFRNIGMSDSTIGALWGLGVAAEVALFAFYPRSVSPVTMIRIGSAGTLLRWIVLAETSSFALIALSQTLHALSFAAVYLGAIAFISEEIEEKNTATGALAAYGGGLLMALMIPFSGWLFEHFGARTFYGAAALAILALLSLFGVHSTARVPAASSQASAR